MEITDDFTTLEKDIRKCQTEIRKEDCVTAKYLDDVKKTCKCLPFNLQNYSSHNIMRYTLKSLVPHSMIKMY